MDAERGYTSGAFADAALYDWEYRRRRADVNFYRTLAAERLGPRPGPLALDLACGTGRLLLPLVRDGHRVLGLDGSADMLARAAARLSRLRATHRTRAQLVRADLRAFAVSSPVELAVCAFHSVQHLLRDDDLLAFFRCVRASLTDDGWFAFDVLPAHPEWLARAPDRRWSRTTFRHPTTGKRLVYSTNHTFDPTSQVLHMRFHYQPVDTLGRRCGRERTAHMYARQLSSEDVAALLARAGLRVIARYADFDLRAHEQNLPFDVHSNEHVYIARPQRPGDLRRRRRENP